MYFQIEAGAAAEPVTAGGVGELLLVDPDPDEDGVAGGLEDSVVVPELVPELVPFPPPLLVDEFSGQIGSFAK